MAITSEIIGKLGGADVQSFPVEGSTSSSSGTVIHTIEAPAGETWLVAVIGTITTPASGRNGYPEIVIGNTRAAFSGVGGASALVTGTVEIRLRRNWSLGSDSFTGHVYAVKL